MNEEGVVDYIVFLQDRIDKVRDENLKDHLTNVLDSVLNELDYIDRKISEYEEKNA